LLTAGNAVCGRAGGHVPTDPAVINYKIIATMPPHCFHDLSLSLLNYHSIPTLRSSSTESATECDKNKEAQLSPTERESAAHYTRGQVKIICSWTTI